jgi:hypothetical protein
VRPAAAAPPSNDDFENATAVSSLPFTDTVDATDATPESDDPTNCGYGDHTVWYEQATSDMHVFVIPGGVVPRLVDALPTLGERLRAAANERLPHF